MFLVEGNLHLCVFRMQKKLIKKLLHSVLLLYNKFSVHVKEVYKVH